MAYDVVCGSDGRTYASECYMNKYACEEKRTVTLQSDKACGKYSFFKSIY